MVQYGEKLMRKISKRDEQLEPEGHRRVKLQDNAAKTGWMVPVKPWLGVNNTTKAEWQTNNQIGLQQCKLQEQ